MRVRCHQPRSLILDQILEVISPDAVSYLDDVTPATGGWWAFGRSPIEPPIRYVEPIMSEHGKLAETKLPRGARRKMETRHRLVEAAKAIMARSGVDGAAIAEIAEEADVGFGSFYNHFSTKTEIAMAALQSEVEKLQLEAQPQHTEAGSVASFIRRVLAQGRSEPTRAAFQVQAFNSISGLTNPLVGHLREIVRRGTLRGEFQTADVDLTSEMIASMMFGTLRHALSTSGRKDSEALLLESIFRVLAVPSKVADKLLAEIRSAGSEKRLERKASGLKT
jgi:AcrR family transcriptional regulator